LKLGSLALPTPLPLPLAGTYGSRVCVWLATDGLLQEDGVGNSSWKLKYALAVRDLSVANHDASRRGRKVRGIFTQGAVKVIHSSTLRSGAIAFYDVGTDLPDTWHVPKVAHVLVRRSRGLHEPAPISIT
jgi:hypothetical protein